MLIASSPTLASRVRLARNRAAARYDTHAVLIDEVGERLVERLDVIKLAPQRIIDIGCADLRLARRLVQRFPGAAYVGIEPAAALLQQREPASGKGSTRIVAEPTRLPLRNACGDLLICNLGAYWCASDTLLAEMLRVSAPGALLLFSTFGPQTLHEFRDAFPATDRQAHVLDFADLQQLGDALARTGFIEPVTQTEQLTLSYSSLQQLTDELAALGLRMPAQTEKGLLGKHRWQAVAARYPRDVNALLPATFDITYATAWKPLRPQRLADGRQVIDIAPYKRRP